MIFSEEMFGSIQQFGRFNINNETKQRNKQKEREPENGNEERERRLAVNGGAAVSRRLSRPGELLKEAVFFNMKK